MSGTAYRTPWGLIANRPLVGYSVSIGLLGNATYQSLYVPAPAVIAADPRLAPLAGLSRHTLATGDAARRAILAEWTLSLGQNVTPDEDPPQWLHGPGGNVLYLDGHATWVPIDAVRRTVVGRANNPNGMSLIAVLLRALDR